MATATETVNTKENCSPTPTDVKSPPSKKIKTDGSEGITESTTPILRFTKLSSDAMAPTYATDEAAGVDLYSASDCLIPANSVYLVPTDIQVIVPKGCYGRIAPRSGLATSTAIDVGAGVIDPDYRGSIKVVLYNRDSVDFAIKKGERIAQMICERYERCKLLEIEQDKTDRDDDDDFGSNGA